MFKRISFLVGDVGASMLEMHTRVRPPGPPHSLTYTSGSPQVRSLTYLLGPSGFQASTLHHQAL